MIGREAENHEKYGTLLFDMFDNLENMRYNNLLSVINKFLVTKLYKLLATEPYSVADHMFAYYITNNEFGGRYLDSVTVVNKALQMNFIKIPTITSMDLSSYHFEGPKSQEVRWGLFYWQHVDDLLYMLVPQFGFVYEQHRGQRYRALSLCKKIRSLSNGGVLSAKHSYNLLYNLSWFFMSQPVTLPRFIILNRVVE
ncbi:hypothetical protein JHK87_018564 [Glycine soja]|nr:hypothetical protein JHK87_018564 [Glycine soja]